MPLTTSVVELIALFSNPSIRPEWDELLRLTESGGFDVAGADARTLHDRIPLPFQWS